MGQTDFAGEWLTRSFLIRGFLIRGFLTQEFYSGDDQFVVFYKRTIQTESSLIVVNGMLASSSLYL